MEMLKIVEIEKPELRLFISLNFSEIVTHNILDVIVDLQKVFPSGKLRWVKPENIHLTLRFLGNVSSDKLVFVKEAIIETSKRSYPCSINLKGLGGYPSKSKPRTVWLSCIPDQNLLALRSTLNLQLGDYGFPEDKSAFKPHITLVRVPARLTSNELKTISDKLKKTDLPNIGIAKFTSVNLFKSELAFSGPTYTLLLTANLISTNSGRLN